jgi:hypothetical protein
MIFRLYHETRGAHVHCRLFAGPREGALGKCGDLVMRDAEFHAFVDRFPGMEFRKEGVAHTGDLPPGFARDGWRR